MKAVFILPIFLLFSFLFLGATKMVSQLSHNLTGNGLREVSLNRDFDLNHCCTPNPHCHSPEMRVSGNIPPKTRPQNADTFTTHRHDDIYSNKFCFADDQNWFNGLKKKPVLTLRLSQPPPKQLPDGTQHLPMHAKLNANGKVYFSKDSVHTQFGFSYGSALQSNPLHKRHSHTSPDSGGFE